MALEAMLASNPSVELDLLGPPIATILQGEDPDLVCWMLAREIARRADGWLPPALERFRERAELEARFRSQSRQGREPPFFFSTAAADRQVNNAAKNNTAPKSPPSRTSDS